jgi:hypothetical protein
MVANTTGHCGWTDVTGIVGVALIVGSYFWLQIGRWSTATRAYSVANATGASLVLISLSVSFNLSAFLIEAFWFLISLIGLFRKHPRKD